MEEDIKILDEVVGRSKELREKDFGMLIGVKEMQAIENLIKGYRELESEIQHKNDQLFLIDKQYERHYIPKSKVKELCKEYYEKAVAEPYDCTTANYKHSQLMGGWRALNKLLMEDK